jgi:hypothetical protein
LSFCDADGRRVFLDLGRDRYFCLSDDADHAFAALAEGADLDGAAVARLETLRQKGILVAADGAGPPRPCRGGRFLHAPLDDEAPPRIGWPATLRAALLLLRAKHDLRHRPLGELCSGLASRKARLCLRARTPQPGELAAIAFTFHASGQIVGALDQCLALSLAIARRGLAQGLRSELVFGVKVRPFQAHAWVLIDNVLISDRRHVVAQFTPIATI